MFFFRQPRRPSLAAWHSAVASERPLASLSGCMILTILNNGLGLLSASSTQILLVNGAILLLVVLLDGRLGISLARVLRLGSAKSSHPS